AYRTCEDEREQHGGQAAAVLRVFERQHDRFLRRGTGRAATERFTPDVPVQGHTARPAHRDRGPVPGRRTDPRVDAKHRLVVRAARQVRLALRPLPLPLRGGRRRAGKPGSQQQRGGYGQKPTTPQPSSQHSLPPCGLTCTPTPPGKAGGRARSHAQRVPARTARPRRARAPKKPRMNGRRWAELAPRAMPGDQARATVMTMPVIEMTPWVEGAERGGCHG